MKGCAVGRLQLDLHAAGRTNPALDNDALDRARMHFKRIKRGDAGWEQDARDVLDVAHAQAMRCAEQADRDPLLAAFERKVDRLRAQVTQSPHRVYGLTKLARKLTPDVLSQEVMAVIADARPTLFNARDLQRLALDLTAVLAMLEQEGASFVLMQRLKPAGERARAMMANAKTRAQEEAMPALRKALLDKLTPLVGDDQARVTADGALARLREGLSDAQKNRHTITPPLEKWMWGQAVTARSKRRPVYKEAVEGVLDRFFDDVEGCTRPFTRAFEDLFDAAFDKFSDDSPQVKDFELLTDRMMDLASQVAETLGSADAEGAVDSAARDAWDDAEERVLEEAVKEGERAVTQMVQTQRARLVRDRALPDDELKWQYHLRQVEGDEAIARSVDACIAREMRAWRARFPHAAEPSVTFLRERANGKASNARLAKQLDMLAAMRAAAEAPRPAPAPPRRPPVEMIRRGYPTHHRPRRH